ncbi:MAG TPA: hypothetical protein VKC60_17195, partial [Opitutaceae bacterium]|nr:hypothetical protein [Opitutaceae bacterium]
PNHRSGSSAYARSASGQRFRCGKRKAPTKSYPSLGRTLSAGDMQASIAMDTAPAARLLVNLNKPGLKSEFMAAACLNLSLRAMPAFRKSGWLYLEPNGAARIRRAVLFHFFRTSCDATPEAFV